MKVESFVELNNAVEIGNAIEIGNLESISPFVDPVFFWDAQVARSSIVGPAPEWSYAGALPDGQGGTDSSGNPVVHDEGVWCGPGYTNELPSGAEDLSTWTLDGVTVSSGLATESLANSTHRLYESATTTGATTESVLAKYNGRNIQISNNLTGYVNFDLQNGAVALESGATGHIEDKGDGWYLCSATFPSTSIILMLLCCIDSLAAGRSPSYQGDGSSGVYLADPQVVESDYLFPYIPPATSVVSAASSTGGNGINVPIDTSMLAAFNGTLTLTALVTMGVGSDELNSGQEFNVSTVDDSADVPLTFGKDGTGAFISFADGTNTAKVYTTWNRNDVLLMKGETNTAGTQIRSGYANITDSDTSFTNSSFVTFTGTFNPDSYDRFCKDITVPIWKLQRQLWSAGEVADAEIFKLAERYGHA